MNQGKFNLETNVYTIHFYLVINTLTKSNVFLADTKY